MDNDEEIITQENDTGENGEIETEEEAQELIDEAGEQSTPEVDELKKKLATAEAQKDHWKKKANTSVKKENAEELSSKDLYALMNSKVPEEDVDDVVRAAKALDMSIPEALKSNIVKTILSDTKEKRTSADVANTDNTRMGPTQLSDEALVANAEKGELPEDPKDIERLIAAKSNQ